MLLVRRAQPEDAEGIAAVHAASGRDAYVDIVPDEALTSPTRLRARQALWTEVLARLGEQTTRSIEAAWVAVDTDAPSDVVGFIHTAGSNDHDATETSAEITSFYVATERQAERIGSRLFLRAVDHLVASGCDDLRLWMLEGNERAQRFYEGRGWRLDGATRRVPVEDYAATEVRLRCDLATLETQAPWRSPLPMLDVMLPQRLTANRYLADAPGWFGPRVFGGAVVAQVVAAASLASRELGGAADGTRAHSLHTHFLRAVQPGPVELRVEAMRTGRTFTTMRVDSMQGGRLAATSLISFHADEDAVPYQLPMADVPLPDALPVAEDAPPPFEVRWIGPSERRVDGTYESTRRSWLRLVEPMPDDPLAALLVHAFLSDLTGTSFRPHNLEEWGTHTDASIDHAVWFHRPPRTDGWLFCDFHCVANLGGRSVVRGVYYDERGDLVLSMAQELLIRPL